MLKNELIEEITGQPMHLNFMFTKLPKLWPVVDISAFFFLQRLANFDLWFLQSGFSATLYIFSAIVTNVSFSDKGDLVIKKF